MDKRNTRSKSIKPKPERFIRLEDAADILKISKWTLYKLTLNRKIEFSKPNGKIIYFTEKSLSDYASRNTQKAAA